MPSGPTTGNNSFFTACDAGKWRVPRPAMGMIALRTEEFALMAHGKKSEIRNPKEIRSLKSEKAARTELCSAFRFRASDFGLLSDFGFRISDLSSRSRLKPPPSARAKGVTFRAELNCAGRCAFEDVGHDADAPGEFDGDLRDMFFERGD